MVKARKIVAWLSVACICAPLAPVYAQSMPADPEMDAILSSDLADLTVTSVMRRPQKLSATASAVYVVTKEDIHRIGANTIPDALRIVPGVQVARVSSNEWAVSARGFNGTFSNKMLVMIDGQSIYTPVFSGTYWDDRMVPMKEVERIEVIRGPGASMWGANAMNGVINIITKSAASEQGGYTTAALGNELGEVGGGYAAKLGENSDYRVYGSYYDADSSVTPAGRDQPDDWNRMRAGFRIDGTRDNLDQYSITGRAYTGRQDNVATVRLPTTPFSVDTISRDTSQGLSLSGAVKRQFADDSTGDLRVTLDHYTRLEQIADQHVNMLDIDWQHDMATSARNNFTWGAGYRFMNVGLEGSFTARVSEVSRNYNLFSAFAQNEYALIPDELFFTVGTKVEHNDFTGLEIQPNARLAWEFSDKHTLWAAVSRAVRSPSILEDDLNLIVQTGVGPTYSVLYGDSDVRSEELIAYELGYRAELSPTFSIDTTVYLNDYDHLATYEAGTPFSVGIIQVNPVYTGNRGQGYVYGFETSATWKVLDELRLMGSYSFAEMYLWKSGSNTTSLESTEDQLPQHVLSLRSYWDVTPELRFDNMLYFVDQLGTINGYMRYDSRLGWQVTPSLELSLTGYNLLQDQHPEFPALDPSEIERSVIGRATWRF